MFILTMAVAGVILLFAGVLLGRKIKARATLAPARATRSISPTPAPAPRHHAPAPAARVTTPPAPRHDDGASEVGRLKLKLINCFGGNAGAMSRSVTFERKKFPHLSEAELLKKMLYDFERGH
jgi:hypothetical protein